ncbi:MAG: peptidase M23 [Nitrospirales bacterium]|nr:MAG: peptidase M23 [Nitrospirales bacterium]
MSIYRIDQPFSKSRLPGKILLVITLLIASIFPLKLVPSAKEQRPGIDGQLSAKQGEVLWVHVPVGTLNPTKVTGTFLKRNIPFIEESSTTYVGLLGIDMQDKPSLHELDITITTATGTEHRSYTVLVMKENYSVQHLKLPKKKVDLDDKTLIRVKAERKEMMAAFDSISPHPFWEGPFMAPVKGRISGRFGSRRVINGQAKNPHSGEDIAAPKGTKVVAMNTGTVSLTLDHFFTGKGVLLNHGVGLYSMYFHLSTISVKEGEVVKKGQIIGQVGSTGRATGPHLHWGVRLNGSRINPYSLINLPMKS